MRNGIIAGLLVLLLVPMAAAQVEKGDREIQLQGSIFTVEGVTMVTVSALYGYFVTPKMEWGGGPTISHVGSSFYDETNISLTFFGRHNFVTGEKMVPYVSGQLYQYDLSPAEGTSFTDYTYLQAGGGFKYFVSENVAYDVSGNLGFGLGGGDISLLIFGGISAFF
jgi:hypothetical protein